MRPPQKFVAIIVLASSLVPAETVTIYCGLSAR
jgi:hypothetical protein